MSNQRKRPKPGLSQTSAAARAQAAARAAERERTKGRKVWIVVGSVLGVLLVVGGITAFVMTRPEPEPVPVSADAQDLGCYSCHTADGSRSEGPSWKDLAGSEVTLADGTTVVADEAYLRRAMLEPGAEVVAGFQPSMPTVELTDAQVDRLVAYIQSLSD